MGASGRTAVVPGHEPRVRFRVILQSPKACLVNTATLPSGATALGGCSHGLSRRRRISRHACHLHLAGQNGLNTQLLLLLGKRVVAHDALDEGLLLLLVLVHLRAHLGRALGLLFFTRRTLRRLTVLLFSALELLRQLTLLFGLELDLQERIPVHACR